MTKLVQIKIQKSCIIKTGSNAIAPVGGSQPHDNMQPYLCVSFIISLFGIFPSQS